MAKVINLTSAEVLALFIAAEYRIEIGPVDGVILVSRHDPRAAPIRWLFAANRRLTLWRRLNVRVFSFTDLVIPADAGIQKSRI